MKVTLERLPESRVLLDIEVDQDRLERSLDSAYKRVAKRARIPGFRPGKAPRRIVEQMIGREGLIREALDNLVPDAYNDAIEAESVEAVDQPELEIVELEPVRFKATVAVRPTVELGDYTSVRVEAEPVEVTREMVDEQVDMLRRRFAIHAPVERPAAWNDIVTADVAATVEEEEFLQDEDAEVTLREDQVLFVPGLAQAFIGMSAGEEKSLDLDLPDDFQVARFQGKTASFTLKVKDVKEEQLPDADDELAAQVNEEEFKTFDDLRKRIEDDLRDSLQRQEDARVQQEALDRMVEIASLEYPRVFVEREVDDLVREAVGNDRQQYLTYLSRLGKTEEDFRREFEETAVKRVERSLVMTNVADAEGLTATPEEVNARLDELVAPAGDESARLRELFGTPEGISSIQRNLLTEKTLARIREIALAKDETEPAEAPKRTRKSKKPAGQPEAVTEEVSE